MGIGLDELGYDERLYILAFDHRGSFEKMVGDVERVPGAKTLIWEGFQRAVELGAPKEVAGVLVDGQYGPSVAREAKAGGYLLAMPVEKSGQDEFDFEYGEQFGDKIEEFDPDFSKVLVRYNPEGDRELNERQAVELRPQLMLEAILQLQNAGVEPDVWKIEGISDREACNKIATLTRREGRDKVSCIVLGRGASDEKVEEWLRAAAGL